MTRFAPPVRLRRALPLALLGAVLALGGAAPAAAGGAHDRHFGAALEANAARLGLSAETLAQVRSLIAEADVERDALHDKLHVAHTTMRTLLAAPHPDEAAVMRQAEEIGGLDTALFKLRVRTLLRIRPLLTPAQLAELEKIRAERLAPVVTACKGEIDASCPDAQGHELVDCLRHQRDHISPACDDALSDLRSRR